VYKCFIKSQYVKQHRLIAKAELALWAKISDVYAINTEAFRIARLVRFKLFVVQGN
jgi:hypothetical protein